MKMNRQKAKKLSTVFVVFGILLLVGTFFGLLPRTYGFHTSIACFILYALVEIGILIFSKRGSKK